MNKNYTTDVEISPLCGKVARWQDSPLCGKVGSSLRSLSATAPSLTPVTACMTAAAAYMTAYLLSPLTLRYSTVSNSVITVPRPSPGLLSLLARLPIVDLSRGTYVIMLCILVSLCRELIEQFYFKLQC